MNKYYIENNTKFRIYDIRIHTSENSLLSCEKHKSELFESEQFHEYHIRFVEMLIRFNLYIKDINVSYLYVGVMNKNALSPYSSPFTYYVEQMKTTESQINFFLNGISEILISLDIEKFYFTLFPDFYDYELHKKISNSLIYNKFVPIYSDINSHIDLSLFESVDIFLTNCSYSFKKSFNKAMRSHLDFFIASTPQYDDVYRVIESNRLQKNYPLKISIEHFRDLYNSDVLNFKCFYILKQTDMIASCVAVELSRSHVFILYWGDQLEFRTFSPMSFLALNLIDYYKNEGFSFLDLGPSSVKGVINQGLYDFKQNLISLTTEKITFLKIL